MKKASMALLIIVCLLSVSFLKDNKISVKASSKTWTVNGGSADFNTIQDAINSPLVGEGDIIYVRNGTYHENVVVNKTVSLVGENQNNTIIDGSGIGSVISIHASVNNVSIKGFTISKSGMYPYSGIFIDHSIGNIIINNKIINNSDGISLSHASGNVIFGNIILSNNEGISLYSSGNNVIFGNIIYLSSYDGIFLYSASSNVISRNIILHNNIAGISLSDSTKNMIYSNTISDNNNGIRFSLSSTNNTIYHNNFNNTDQVWGDLPNVWDYGDEGNYWSSYSGQDLNRDGIGDKPYAIDKINQDNHPLMGIFSDFDATLERETYQIAIISNSTISNFKFEIGGETGNKIIRFNVIGKHGSVGFSRVTIPIALMENPYIVLIDGREIVPTLLNISSETNVCLYLTYLNSNYTIGIISSKTLRLYYELLANYLALQGSLHDLNATYYGLLNAYGVLLGNYSSLLESFGALNESYQKHLLDYSEQNQNIRSLMYIFAATTAVLIIATIYLSKHAYAGIKTKTKVIEEQK